MKVGFQLLGTVPGGQDVVYFKLESDGGKDIDHQRRAYEHFKRVCNVHGLNFGLRGRSGLIVMKAHNDQLRPEVVADIRRHVEDALNQIK